MSLQHTTVTAGLLRLHKSILSRTILVIMMQLTHNIGDVDIIVSINVVLSVA